MPVRIEFHQGDITSMEVDAIVNAANTDLLLGAGVAGAIRRKGGERIQEECNRIGPIALGGAAVTTGGNLKALYVVHAAGMSLGGQATAESIRLAVKNSLERAEEKAFRSIAFPAIGTGVAGFPMQECAHVMLSETLEHLKARTCLERILFVLFDSSALETFKAEYQRLVKQPSGARL